MMADELLNAQDLVTAKKHDTFHSEVITGKTGGLSTGANIDYATNAVTGQVQKTLPATVNGIDWSYVGKFADGVTFTKKTDFAIDSVGVQWIYTGSLPFPATAGTVPSEPTYQAVHVRDHNSTSNRNAVGAHDSIYRRKTTVSEIVTGVFNVGDLLEVSDRANAPFNVVSGGTADGYSVLNAGGGNTAELQHDGEVNIEWLGAIRNGSDNGAIDYCTTKGFAAVVPAYKYHYTETDNRDSNPTIIGVKRPSCNTDKTQLEGGSILVGTLQLKGKNPTVMNIGIDHGSVEFPADASNALVLAHENPFTAESIATVQNVIALGREVEDAYHAILVEGHYDTNIDNIVGIKTYFGAALKNTRNNISNAIFIDNGSDNLIIKSDTTSGRVSMVNANNIVCEGAGTAAPDTTSFSIRLSAFDNDMENINIGNVVTKDAAYSVYLDASAANAGTMKNVNISNVAGSGMGRAILMDGGSGTGLIDEVNIDGVNIADVEFRAYEQKGNIGKVNVDNFYANAKAGNAFTASYFQVTAGESFSGSNIKLPIDGDLSNPATLNLANSYTHNKLSGNNICKLNGAGIPREGYIEQTLTAANSMLTPVCNGNRSNIVRISQAAAYSISIITRTMPGGTRFPHGYELLIVNDGTFNLTLKHNLAGWISTKTASDVVVLPNSAIKFVFGGSLWHEV